MKIARLLQVVAIALGSCLVAASSPAQDQPALGDVARQQKSGPKAKINITDDNLSQPPSTNATAGKAVAGPSSAQADSAQPAPELAKSDSSPAAADSAAPATADVPDKAANETPEHAAARQKLQELQSYKGKLDLQIGALQKRLETETDQSARQTLMGMLQDDQQDLEATNKDVAAAQKTLDDLDQASNQ
jgi:hypothetical protein